MGSYPTHATPAFAQLLQLGSFWSHRFFRRRHLLQALTLRKLDVFPTDGFAALEAACGSAADGFSLAGERSWTSSPSSAVAAAGLWRWRFAGCELGFGGLEREAAIFIRGRRERHGGCGLNRDPAELGGGGLQDL